MRYNAEVSIPYDFSKSSNDDSAKGSSDSQKREQNVRKQREPRKIIKHPSEIAQLRSVPVQSIGSQVRVESLENMQKIADMSPIEEMAQTEMKIPGQEELKFLPRLEKRWIHRLKRLGM